MDDSILNSVKKKVNLTPDNHDFDEEIVDYINAAFGTLHQLGIGPSAGYMIEDESDLWDYFLLGEVRYNPVKLYVAQKVRAVFDPPPSPAALQALKEMIKELEVRLSIVREGIVHGGTAYNTDSSSNPSGGQTSDTIIDGGNPLTDAANTTVFDGGTP